MAVYIDSLKACVPNRQWRWRQSCHLYADTIEELHAFAAKIGMKRSWFQNHTRLPHYDLTPDRRARAVALGAIESTNKHMVSYMRPRKNEIRS